MIYLVKEGSVAENYIKNNPQCLEDGNILFLKEYEIESFRNDIVFFSSGRDGEDLFNSGEEIEAIRKRLEITY
jgi:hypothetical protein